MKLWLVGCVLALVAVGCGGVDPAAEVQEETKVCDQHEVACPVGCHSGGGCPAQCHCPGYTKCGDLRCGTDQICCSGPVEIFGGTAHPIYSCNPPNTICQ
jgi:hypothetical protein